MKSSTRVTVKSVTFLQPPLEKAEGPERKRLSGAPEAINQLLVTQRWQGQGLGWDRHSAFKPPTHWLTDTYCSQTLDNVAFYFLLGYSETLGFAHHSKIIRSAAVPSCSRPPPFNKEELMHGSLVCRSTAKAILFFLALDKWMLGLEIFAKLNFLLKLKMPFCKLYIRIWFNILKPCGRWLYSLFSSCNKILIQCVIQDEDDRKKAHREGKDPTGTSKLSRSATWCDVQTAILSSSHKSIFV